MLLILYRTVVMPCVILPVTVCSEIVIGLVYSCVIYVMNH
jgi:hypothetical protein